jgi:hypothetical protein
VALSSPEIATQASDAAIWQSLDEISSNDWTVLLDDGPTALDWRLLTMDTAAQSIDLQTFLWTIDTVGAMVLAHFVSSAHPGKILLSADDPPAANPADASSAPALSYRQRLEDWFFSHLPSRASCDCTWPSRTPGDRPPSL